MVGVFVHVLHESQCVLDGDVLQCSPQSPGSGAPVSLWNQAQQPLLYGWFVVFAWGDRG